MEPPVGRPFDKPQSLGFVLELLGALIIFGIPVAVGDYGWRYYRALRLEREFGELRFYNPQLHQNIAHEVCSHLASYSQQIVHELGPQIGTD